MTPKRILAALAVAAVLAGPPVALAATAARTAPAATPGDQAARLLASAERLRSHLRLRAQLHRRRLERAAAASVPRGVLAAIAACESHGDPRAIGGGGLYRGAYQMTFSAWRSVGGAGDPAGASMAEQTRRAALLYRRAGASQWPVCGR